MPFTAAEFFDGFRRYNEAVWPLQLVLAAAGLVVVFLAVRPRSNGGRAALLIVASLWLWMGAVYHLMFFRRINPAAAIFGSAFIMQSGLLAWTATQRRCVALRARPTALGITGAVMVFYALVMYPLIGVLAGHRYPATPTFGLPCPTTIFTLGVLLWWEPRPPRAVAIIPTMWAAIGTVGAVQLGVPQDFGLTVAAMIAVPIILFSRRRDTLATAA
jgi:hypothetical protein